MRYDDVLNFALQRHQVYERKAAGLPRGEWTDNLVLSRYKFTNVYRELDRNTVWIRENVRERFWGSDETIPAVFVARLINRIPVLEVAFGQMELFDSETPLDSYISRGAVAPMEHAIRTSIPTGPWATSAYMMKTPTGKDKLAGLLHIAEEFWRSEWSDILECRTLEDAHKIFLRVPYMGGFLSGQMIADLKYTPVLSRASDWWTWAASGPGSRAGMNLVLERYPADSISEKDWRREIRKLWDWINPHLEQEGMPPVHMQDLQNILCEFSKFDRGYSRCVYRPGG